MLALTIDSIFPEGDHQPLGLCNTCTLLQSSALILGNFLENIGATRNFFFFFCTCGGEPAKGLLQHLENQEHKLC